MAAKSNPGWAPISRAISRVLRPSMHSANIRRTSSAPTGSATSRRASMR